MSKYGTKKPKPYLDHPKRVVLEYRDFEVEYEILSCYHGKNDVFCHVMKNGVSKTGISMSSLLSSKFVKKEKAVT